MDGYFDVKFIMVLKTGLVIETDPWPSKWSWYQGRVSWVGNLFNNKAAFRLTKAELNDSRTFYCEVEWSGNYDLKRTRTTI